METIVTIQGNYAYLVKGNETTQVVISEYVNGGAKHLTAEQIEALAEAGVTQRTFKYARKCDSCDAGMNEGYVICGGEQYFCSDECLHKHYTAEQWNDMYADGEGDSYYTSWEEDEYEYED